MRVALEGVIAAAVLICIDQPTSNAQQTEAAPDPSMEFVVPFPLRADVAPDRMPRMRNPTPLPSSLFPHHWNENFQVKLDLCIDGGGVVRSAVLIEGSGSDRIDSSVLAWTLQQTFEPAQRNGASVGLCGHRLIYEGQLENLR